MRIFSGGGKLRSCEKRFGSRASSSSGSCTSTGLTSSTRRGHTLALFQPLAHPRHESAHSQQVVHELRERLGAIFVAFREVADHALVEVDLQLVAVLDR